jgi:hypothetical protein
MKQSLIIAVVACIAFILSWVYFKSKSSGDDAEGLELNDSPCIKVNRNKFPIRWDSDKIPAGTVTRAAKDVFNSEESMTASIINGFFRSIDVYPSQSSVKFYQDDLVKYHNSNAGLPWWSVVTGELSC